MPVRCEGHSGLPLIADREDQKVTKKVVHFRVCDKCERETDAVATEKVTFNGEAFTLDLCQGHSDTLHVDMDGWTRLGTKVGSSSHFGVRRLITGPVIVDLRTPTKTVGRGAIDEPPVPTERRQMPTYPMTASRWEISHHANERMAMRKIDTDSALHAAEAPEVTLPSKTQPGCQVRSRGAVSVVVNPVSEVILTVYPVNEDEDAFVRPDMRRAGAR